VIYNDSSEAHPYTDPTTQGATIAFNVLDINGNHVGYSHVEKVANQKAIYLRAGGLCNPGGIASYLKVEPWQFKRAWSAGYRCGGADSESLEIINGKPTGVVRASLGAMSVMAEVDTLIVFLSDAFKDTTAVGTSGVKFDQLPQRATPTTESCPVAIPSHHCKDDNHSLTQSSQSVQSRGSLSFKQQILYIKQSLRRRHPRVAPNMDRDKEQTTYLNVGTVDQRDPRVHAETTLQMLVHATQGRRSGRKGTLKFWKIGRVQSN
jgi:hypothetical protein